MRSCLGAVALAVLVVSGEAAGEGASGTGQRLEPFYVPSVRMLAGNLIQLGIIGLVALPFQLLAPAVRRRPNILTYEFWLDVLFACQGLWLTLISFSAAV